MRSIRDLKSSAKAAMKGNTGLLVMAMLAYTALSFAGNMLTDAFFPGTGIVNIVISEIFMFVLTLVFGIFYAGVRYLYLNVARGRVYSMEDMIYFFRNDPDKVIVATFVLSAISIAVSIPVNIYIYNMEVGTSIQEQMDWAVTTMMLMLVVVAVSELLTLPFEMTYYLMADHPEMSGMEALKNSVRMLKGNMGKLLLMKISFIPLMLLSVFTLYIALIWIIPYMEMTTAEFYRALTGEPDESLMEI